VVAASVGTPEYLENMERIDAQNMVIVEQNSPPLIENILSERKTIENILSEDHNNPGTGGPATEGPITPGEALGRNARTMNQGNSGLNTVTFDRPVVTQASGLYTTHTNNSQANTNNALILTPRIVSKPSNRYIIPSSQVSHSPMVLLERPFVPSPQDVRNADPRDGKTTQKKRQIDTIVNNSVMN
jgi:hypothetical protein